MASMVCNKVVENTASTIEEPQPKKLKRSLPEQIRMADIIASIRNQSKGSPSLIETYATQLDKAEANYSIEFHDDARLDLDRDLDSVYDDCKDDSECEASWNIVFCRNIKLPAFGWLQDGGSEPVLVINFVHDETSMANAIKIGQGESCRLDLANASFKFCDRYNTYALHQLRSIVNFGDGHVREPAIKNYVTTIALSGSIASVRDLSGKLVLEHAINESITLHEIRSMAQYVMRKPEFNVICVLENGELMDKRLYHIVLRPGMELCAMQAQIQQDAREAAERQEAELREAAERREGERRDKEQAINGAKSLGFSSALKRLSELLNREPTKMMLQALVKSDGLVHPAKRALLGQW